MIDVGTSGRQSDGGVFKASNMGKNFHENAMNVPAPSVQHYRMLLLQTKHFN